MSPKPDPRYSDYVALKVVRDRASESKARGDKYYAKVVEIIDSAGEAHRPKFRANFNVFADEIAHGLRRRLLYRTDGGRFARGLVRANGHLKIVHDYYHAHDYEDGYSCNLTIIIVRRKDRKPPFRWAMDILYRINDHVDGDEDVIVADKERVAKLRCLRLDKIFNTIEAQLHSLPKHAALEIENMIDLAESVGCAENLDLWYFNRLVMKDYISWRTDDKTRRVMTKETSGRFPFDGWTFPHGNWRIYPFKNLMSLYGTGDIEKNARSVLRTIQFHRNSIIESFKDVNRELNSTAPARSNAFIPGLGGGAEIYGLGKPFFDELAKLRNNKNHLYSAFAS